MIGLVVIVRPGWTPRQGDTVKYPCACGTCGGMGIATIEAFVNRRVVLVGGRQFDPDELELLSSGWPSLP